MIKINKKLESLIKNKSLAVVGPSKHLFNTNFGKKIDQFDLIVRLNDIYPWNYEKDYGSKNDIISLNCGTIDLNEFNIRLKKLCENLEKPKFLICPVIKALGSDNWTSWANDYDSPSSLNLKKINIYNIPSYCIDIEDYKILYNKIGSEPNSGMMLLMILLQYPIKQLFLTGISFYSQGNSSHKSYRPEYDYRGKEDYITGELSHPQFAQKYYFKNNIMKKYANKIIIDSYLNNLLNLKHKLVINV